MVSSRVSANFAAIYQWTSNFEVRDEGEGIGEARLQLKFGPSAWFANEQDTSTWKRTVDRASVDYSRRARAMSFMTHAKYREIRQSRVLLRELLDGLEPDDRRLHDEIVDLWRDPAPLITLENPGSRNRSRSSVLEIAASVCRHLAEFGIGVPSYPTIKRRLPPSSRS